MDSSLLQFVEQQKQTLWEENAHLSEPQRRQLWEHKNADLSLFINRSDGETMSYSREPRRRQDARIPRTMSYIRSSSIRNSNLGISMQYSMTGTDSMSMRLAPAVSSTSRSPSTYSDHELFFFPNGADSIPNSSYLRNQTKTQKINDYAPEDEYGWHPVHLTFPDSKSVDLEVLELLGHGSLGVVDEVRVKSTNKKSFVRKRIQVPRLSHHHVIKIIGTYQDGPEHSQSKHFYSILMSPVGENDLKDFLEYLGDLSNKFSLEERMTKEKWIRRWFECLASALAYMHSEGIRHQDIKPSNIIHRQEKIYFTDFSSSSRFDVGHTTSTDSFARISFMYAAPEVAQGYSENYRHGRGTDIFPLGCVYLEMLVILMGSSLEKFHNCLGAATEISQGESGARLDADPQSLPYSISYSGSLAWIEDCLQQQRPWRLDARSVYYRFYTACIKPMMAANRYDRPSAIGVLRSVQAFAERQDWYEPEICPCTSLNASILGLKQ